MRSRSSHAAKSGVGEHAARESESAQRMRFGKPGARLLAAGLSREVSQMDARRRF